MAYGIFNDEQLGKMSFENDFFEELLDLPDDKVKYLDFSKLGKERRIGEGGIYTGHGYVPMLLTDEEISSHYEPGAFPQLEDLLPAESLCVQFYRYDLEAEYACEGSVTEVLPISTERYQQIKEELGATDEELTLITKFCVIPSLQEYIRETEPVKNLNALAVCLDGARAMGKLPLYKALLEATKCQSVEDAAALGCQLTDPTWPDDLYEAILQCENPLYEMRDHWLEHGQPAFSEGQFNSTMEDFVDRNAQTPEQQMNEQSQ